MLGRLLAEAGRREEAFAELDAAASCCPPAQKGLLRQIKALKERLDARSGN